RGGRRRRPVRGPPPAGDRVAGDAPRRDAGGMRVLEIWRFPIKSMRGEQPSAVTVGPTGLAGDRAHALIDQETGKVASAKRPRLWAGLLGMAAEYVGQPDAGAPIAVHFADGTVARSDENGFDERLSAAAGRPVRMQ